MRKCKSFAPFVALILTALLVAGCGVKVPKPPANLQAAAGDGSVSLSWNPSDGAIVYKVYQSETGGGPYDHISDVSGNMLTVNGLNNGITYYFVVTAVNQAGESGYSSEISATPESALPPAPTDLEAVPGDGMVSLSWTASPGALGYKVFKSSSSGGPYDLVDTTDAITMDVIPLSNSTTYFFVVASYNTAGDSPYSNEVSAVPNGPVIVDNFESYSGSLSVPWTIVSDPAPTTHTVVTDPLSGSKAVYDSTLRILRNDVNRENVAVAVSFRMVGSSNSTYFGYKHAVRTPQVITRLQLVGQRAPRRSQK